MKREITAKEKACIKRYVEDATFANQLNLLLHAGTLYEQALYQEGKPFVFDVLQLEELLSDALKLYTAMYKSKILSPSSVLHTKKVDRMPLFTNSMQSKKIPCFYSTSKEKQFLEYYVTTKMSPVLLEIYFDKTVPFIDMEQVLGKDYTKQDEKEILLSPFSHITSIKRITGDFQYPLYTHYLLTITAPKFKRKDHLYVENIYDSVLLSFTKQLRNLKQLAAGAPLSLSDQQHYAAFKQEVSGYLQASFANIESCIIHMTA